MYTSDLIALGRNYWDLVQHINHRNVIRLHHKEETNSHLYIVSTLGQYNLFDYVQNYWNNDNPVPVHLLRQITTGIEFLHYAKIVHSDLTPANILISYPIRGKRRAMIADFESSHRDGHTGAFKHNKKLSEEWMAPELKDLQKRVFTDSSDIYSLGCIYMYVLSNGSQIFGQRTGVGDKALHVQCITESIIAGGLQCHFGLFNKMLEYSPNLRLTSHEVLQHPIFWEMKRKVMFIKSVLKLVTTDESAKSQILSTPGNISFEEWTSQVSEEIGIDLGKYLVHDDSNNSEKKQEWIMAVKEQHGGKELSSIINIMIEIDQHYNDIIRKSKRLVEKYRGGYIEYFIERVPEIPDFVYTAMKEFKDDSLYIYYGTKCMHLKSEWSDLNISIKRSILSKMTLKSNFNCSRVSKHWMKSEQEFYTWMKQSSNNLTRSSFKNAMKNNVNCKEIYCKSSEGWKRNAAPTLVTEIYTNSHIHGIAISNDGTMLAVFSSCNIKIYDSKDLRMKFSRNFSEEIYALHFNGNNSCILVESGDNILAVKIGNRLPNMHSVKCSMSIRGPWRTDNIFLSGNFDEKENKTTLYLNEIGKGKYNSKSNTQYPIQMVKGQTWGGIVQTDSCNVLVFKTDKTKLGFKTWSKSDLTKYHSKQQPETPDHEVDCQGRIWDFVEVPDGNTKKLYILADIKHRDYCFLIIDLDSFKLKTSTVLVPRVFDSIWINLVSNAKYMASGSYSNCAYVWDIKNGLCIAQLQHGGRLISCAIDPIDPQLVITAGYDDKKIKIWRLNTDKFQLQSSLY